jgi:peptidoglycan hydrolase-like protein with peptidoglycan-binding domain
MPKSISKSVGLGGVNLQPDVVTVQSLLNKVTAQDGGPAPALVTDGLCGPKTRDAIRKFQLRQFGPAGADGRVDPGGRTIGRLNEFDAASTTPPPPPPPGPPPLTTRSVIMCAHGGMITVAPIGPPLIDPATGALILRWTDQSTVSGCRLPMPCVRVTWLPMASQELNITSIGITMNAVGAAQGPVIVATS